MRYYIPWFQVISQSVRLGEKDPFSLLSPPVHHAAQLKEEILKPPYQVDHSHNFI